MKTDLIYSDDKGNSISKIECSDDKKLHHELDSIIFSWLEGNIQGNGKPFPNIVNAGLFLGIGELVSSISQYKNASGFVFEATTDDAKAVFKEVAEKYEKHERFNLLETESEDSLIGIYTYQEKDQ